MITIKKGQIYRKKSVPTFQIEITGKKGGRFNSRVLTDKPGVYNGSHKFSLQTLKKEYELLQ